MDEQQVSISILFKLRYVIEGILHVYSLSLFVIDFYR